MKYEFPVELLQKLCKYFDSKNIQAVHIEAGSLNIRGPFGTLEKLNFITADESFALWPEYEFKDQKYPAKIIRTLEWK